ncbi:MAG: chemotaxis protein CheW [Sulfurimonas sp.]|nr:chemotaxis protein CheW [Sulfurimonas sp.]
MIDLIVFSVVNNKYALKIDNIERIIQVPQLAKIPTSHDFIDGIMSYEDKIIKILNFRKLIGITDYELELIELFKKFKKDYLVWITSLKASLYEDVKSTSPHICELGKWIDDFSSYDDRVFEISVKLLKYHKKLHLRGEEVLEIYKKDAKVARNIFENEIKVIYTQTINTLDAFVLEMQSVANSLQKLLIYENEDNIFAIKIDKIDDIAHIQESDIMSGDEEHKKNEFLDIEGILDIDNILINVISKLRLPK